MNDDRESPRPVRLRHMPGQRHGRRSARRRARLSGHRVTRCSCS